MVKRIHRGPTLVLRQYRHDKIVKKETKGMHSLTLSSVYDAMLFRDYRVKVRCGLDVKPRDSRAVGESEDVRKLRYPRCFYDE